ncbi:MAG: hypothetical protein RAK17_04095, partial [Caldisphaera sp.]|nr:hypothetical protein [Caldisphaera sp.]
MNSNFYYILAINLSLLTFYIGALIYALPIPDKYFKRFGPQLIKDSILSFIIILSISFIYSYLDNLALSLGGSWQYFNLWFANSLSFGISIKEIVLVFSSLFSQIP